jgi:hypothetical protein
MPSPSPGMDPYLEHPVYFPDLHERLITSLSEVIQVGLPEPYYAVGQPTAARTRPSSRGLTA